MFKKKLIVGSLLSSTTCTRKIEIQLYITLAFLRHAVICSRHSYKSSPGGETGRCFVSSEKRYKLKPISTVTLFKFVLLLPECYPKLSLDGFNPFLQ